MAKPSRLPKTSVGNSLDAIVSGAQENPFAAKMLCLAFSIRAMRVAGRLAPVKW
jgi:hypothetical protein